MVLMGGIESAATTTSDRVTDLRHMCRKSHRSFIRILSQVNRAFSMVPRGRDVSPMDWPWHRGFLAGLNKFFGACWCRDVLPVNWPCHRWFFRFKRVFFSAFLSVSWSQDMSPIYWPWHRGFSAGFNIFSGAFRCRDMLPINWPCHRRFFRFKRVFFQLFPRYLGAEICYNVTHILVIAPRPFGRFE
jgi:hypothetical protein